MAYSLVAATAVFAWSQWVWSDATQSIVVGTAFLLAYHTVRVNVPPGAHVPVMRAVLPFVGIPVAAALVAVLAMTELVPGLRPGIIAPMCAVAAVAVVVARLTLPRLRPRREPVRIAVVGFGNTAAELATELRGDSLGYVVVGYVGAGTVEPPTPAGSTDGHVPCLGSTGQLPTLVGDHRIDLLLVAPEAARLQFFEEVSATCLQLPVRMMELSLFYEQVFGHVALALINAAWFQYLMHPAYTPEMPRTKRAFDVAVALAATVVLAVPVTVAALLIRRDGGPALYRQRRVGEKGCEFEILKLRTMQVVADDVQRWSSQDDVRVTPIGRVLRRIHLDEAPQLLNVLRGDMTIVGPRPEQPAFVEQLERTIPFYTRRHLVRPGITGWAQIQCGYCGSMAGSAYKVAHDLYYLKRRSLALDVMILGETVRSLIADDQWSSHPECHTLAVPVRLSQTRRPDE